MPAHATGLADEGLTEPAVQGLARRALQLQQEPPRPRLRGRHVAVASRDGQSPDALALRRAARALGARCSVIRPPAGDTASGSWRETSRALAALYDAILWPDATAAMRGALAQQTGRPVLASLCVPEGVCWLLAQRFAMAAAVAGAAWSVCAGSGIGESTQQAWRQFAPLAQVAWVEAGQAGDLAGQARFELVGPVQPGGRLNVRLHSPAGDTMLAAEQQWRHHDLVVQALLLGLLER